MPALNRSSGAAREAAAERKEQLQTLVDHLRSTLEASSEGPDQNTRWMMDAVCERFAFSIEADSDLWWHLFETVTKAQIEAAQQQLQRLKGLPEKIEDELFSTHRFLLDREEERNAAGEQPSGFVSIQSLFDAYIDGRQPAPATVKSFRPKIEAFRDFLGHDNAAAVMRKDVVRWRKHLLEGGGRSGRPLSVKTVKETYLAAVSAVFQWAADDEKLPSNQLLGIRVRGPKRPGIRKGFRDEEAHLILRSALETPSAKLSAERSFAVRWVPWLLAYSGARVNEITQLRAEDLREVDDIWIMHITPEAGTTKTGERNVPLHPHLIEQGFLEQIKGKSGPIFFNVDHRRGGSAENPQARKVGEFLARWVRQIGVDDARVQPNHGWRHRFKSVARDCRMDAEIRDYIQGHVPRTEGEAYGEVSPAATFREISRIPRYRVA